jgi:hypothetical protein
MDFHDLEQTDAFAQDRASLSDMFAQTFKSYLAAKKNHIAASKQIEALNDSLRNNRSLGVENLEVFKSIQDQKKQLNNASRSVESQEKWLREQLTTDGIQLLKTKGISFDVAVGTTVYSLRVTPADEIQVTTTNSY